MFEPKPELVGFRGNPIVKGSETIYELVTAADGFGFGLALVRIGQEPNEKHYHKLTRERYVVVWGGISMQYCRANRDDDRNWVVIDTGGSKLILPEYIHQAHAIGSNHAWLYVYTWPAFDPNDYYPIESSS